MPHRFFFGACWLAAAATAYVSVLGYTADTVRDPGDGVIHTRIRTALMGLAETMLMIMSIALYKRCISPTLSQCGSAHCLKVRMSAWTNVSFYLPVLIAIALWLEYTSHSLTGIQGLIMMPLGVVQLFVLANKKTETLVCKKSVCATEYGYVCWVITIGVFAVYFMVLACSSRIWGM